MRALFESRRAIARCVARIARPFAVATVLLSLAAGCSDDGSVETDRFLSTKTPYEPRQSAAEYERPPEGYRPVFTQILARHGARSLTSDDDLDRVEQLIALAESAGALTELGRDLAPQVESLRRANEALGYGNLSGLGVAEHEALAARLLARLPELFDQAEASGRRIGVVNSGKDRAVDSGNDFTASLAARRPALAPLIDPPVSDAELLYFFALDPDYQDWLAHDARLKDTIGAIEDGARSHREARAMLGRILGADFLDELAAGALPFRDPKTGAPVSLNEVDVARSLYALYQIAPGLRDEGTWTFDRFVSAAPARWFAYVSDAKEFYEKGPSFAGQTITFEMARVLQDDFFAMASANCSASGALAADLRFAQAETIMPLATLMELPGSDRQAAELYTYADDPWRGATVAPYTANIQWDAFADARGDCVIRMLYGEAETRFKAACRSRTPDSHYYALDELRRCYGYADALRHHSGD